MIIKNKNTGKYVIIEKTENIQTYYKKIIEQKYNVKLNNINTVNNIKNKINELYKK